MGRESEGWKVAITTLMNERTAIGGGGPTRRGFHPDWRPTFFPSRALRRV
jgi:hypothetical protein